MITLFVVLIVFLVFSGFVLLSELAFTCLSVAICVIFSCRIVWFRPSFQVERFEFRGQTLSYWISVVNENTQFIFFILLAFISYYVTPLGATVMPLIDVECYLLIIFVITVDFIPKKDH